MGGVIRAGGRAKVRGGGSDEVGEEVRDRKRRGRRREIGGEGEKEGGRMEERREGGRR